MLQRTVFINCVNNLGGSGLASGASPARIDLTWSGIPNVTGYTVQRSTTSGGPYTTVGTTTTTAYSDRTGLTNGDTYYYVLQPFNGAGAVCQSNQAKITVPKKSAL
jgi:fibronectin type 3 domain-containing protein